MMAGMAEWHPPAEHVAVHLTLSAHFVTRSWRMGPAGATQTVMQV